MTALSKAHGKAKQKAQPENQLGDKDALWRGRLGHIHSALAIILIFWRILIASSDHMGDDHYLWHAFRGRLSRAWHRVVGWLAQAPCLKSLASWQASSGC